MYVILVYDIKEKRVARVYKFVRKFLYHKQKSVFEGEIKKEDFNDLIKGLNEIIEEDDHVIIFQLPYKIKDLSIIELGKKSEDDEIIF